MRRYFFLWFALLSLAPSSYGSAASSFIQDHAQPVAPGEISPSLIEDLKNKEILLIGEAHGSNEQPAFAGKLLTEISRFRKVALGLEFPAEIQETVRRFIESGDERILAGSDFFSNPLYHSGRGSAAMVTFLKGLKDLPIEIFCFDINQGFNGDERDTEMAKNILRYRGQHPDRMVVTYSGNRHSRLSRGYPGNESAENMGSELLRLSAGALSLENVMSLYLRFSEGSAWWCLMENDAPACGISRFGPSQSPYAVEVDYEAYYLKEAGLSDGHSATYFLRRLSASLPFVEKTKLPHPAG